jgi:hypothetical protein
MTSDHLRPDLPDARTAGLSNRRYVASLHAFLGGLVDDNSDVQITENQTAFARRTAVLAALLVAVLFFALSGSSTVPEKAAASDLRSPSRSHDLAAAAARSMRDVGRLARTAKFDEDDASIADFAVRAASSYRRILRQIGPTRGRPPAGRRLSQLTSRWRSLHRSAGRDLRNVTAIAASGPASQAKQACAARAIRRVAHGARSAWIAHRALLRRRPETYRRKLASARGVRRAVSDLAACSGATRPTPSTPSPTPSNPTPSTPTKPAPPTPPPPATPAPHPQAPTPGRQPAVAISYFKPLITAAGPENSQVVAPGGTGMNCGAGAERLMVAFRFSDVAIEDLEALWRVPSGQVVPTNVQFDPIRLIGVSGLGLLNGGKLPHGTYSVQIRYAGEVLDEASVTLACPSESPGI